MPEWPEAQLVPRASGYQAAYFALGPVDGVPLLLCHGLAASSLQFVADAQYFASKGYRVIVPDMRGHGRSTCPDQRADEDFSIATMADDTLAILDVENLQSVHWVGNSLGGILALEIMGRQPERLLSFASFGTAYGLDLPTGLVALGAVGYRVLGTKITALVGAPMTSRNPAAQAIVGAMLRNVDVDAAIRAGQAVHRYDLIGNALKFERPILLIRGNLDRAVNAALGPTLTAMAERENFQLIELEGAGHCANLDQPDRMRRLTEEFIGEGIDRDG